MARTAQISKEKRQSITLRQRSVNTEHFKSQPVSAMMKLALMRRALGKEDPE